MALKIQSVEPKQDLRCQIIMLYQGFGQSPYSNQVKQVSNIHRRFPCDGCPETDVVNCQISVLQHHYTIWMRPTPTDLGYTQEVVCTSQDITNLDLAS